MANPIILGGRAFVPAGETTTIAQDDALVRAGILLIEDGKIMELLAAFGKETTRKIATLLLTTDLNLDQIGKWCGVTRQRVHQVWLELRRIGQGFAAASKNRVRGVRVTGLSGGLGNARE